MEHVISASDKSTVALSMIVKDEVEEVKKIIESAYLYFDQMIFVVSDETAAADIELFSREKLISKVEVYHRPWNNRFDEARTFAQEKVITDFWFWIDCDDVFKFEFIPELVQIAQDYDQLLLPYNYAQDEQGNCIAYHWRERLFRTSHPFEWKGWIHETPISHTPFKAHKVNVPVVHLAEDGHVKESLDRNHKILVEAASQTDDPRYKMYLGTSHHARGEHGEALQVLDKFIKVSGSAEDIYRALSCMSECAYLMKRPQVALNYAMQAAALIPEYPGAYWLAAQWEAEQENWTEALEWVKVSETKPEPNTLSVYDPTSRDRARLIAAQCEFMRKNYNDALKWLRKVSVDNPTRGELEEGFINEADAETFLTLLPKFRKYFDSDESLFDALCYDLKFDARVRGLRESVTEPKIWEDDSIVILCGQGYEEWGPHTLDKGMGGSEEAVIYLSRALGKLGYKVTIYGAVENVLLDGENVRYVPWQEFNRQDDFNVFVAWRAPEFTEHVNAKVKLADIHDVLPKSSMKPYADVTYHVKSQYHRDLYPELPDSSFRIIGNGIEKGQFA